MTTLMVTVLAAVTFAQKTTFDFDRGANFARYRTYAWTEGSPVGDRFVDQRITDAVERHLALKGLVRATPGNRPDMLVAYHANFDRNLQVNAFGTGWGGYRYGGSRSGSARVEEILVGTIVVDLVDAATTDLVWRGMATGDVDVDAKPEKRDQNIDRAAAKIFKNYPPSTAERR
jgi:hypothetical protein